MSMMNSRHISQCHTTGREKMLDHRLDHSTNHRDRAPKQRRKQQMEGTEIWILSCHMKSSLS